MKTLVRVFDDADFSGNNVGRIQLESQIAVPAADLVFAVRTMLSRDYSQPYVGDSALDVSSGYADGIWSNDYVTAVSAANNADSTALIVTNTAVADGDSMTYIVIIKQLAASPAAASPVIGSFSGNTQLGILTSSSSGDYLAYQQNPSGSVNAALQRDGGDRWEMLAMVRDIAAGTLSIYRPRTQSMSSAEMAGSVAISSATRLFADRRRGANQSGWSGAFASMHRRALSLSEIDAVYASAKYALRHKFAI